MVFPCLKSASYHNYNTLLLWAFLINLESSTAQMAFSCISYLINYIEFPTHIFLCQTPVKFLIVLFLLKVASMQFQKQLEGTFLLSLRSAATTWSQFSPRVLKIMEKKLSTSCLIDSFRFIK